MPLSRPLKAHEQYTCPLCHKVMYGQKAKTQHHQEKGTLCYWPRGWANEGNKGYRSGWKRESANTYRSRFGTDKDGPLTKGD